MNADELAKILLANIQDINIGNLLKLREYVRIKEADKGIEIEELLDAIIKLCFSYCHKCDDNFYFAQVILLSMSTKKKLKNKEVNRAHIFDSYLLELKEYSI